MRQRLVALLMCAAIFAALCLTGCGKDVFNGNVPKLTAESDDFDTISLSWQVMSDADSYEVWVQEDGEYTLAANVSTNEYEFSCIFNQEYTYKVRAVNEEGKSEYSEPVTAKSRLFIPVNVKTTALPEGIEVTWDEVRGADGYEIGAVGNDSSALTKTVSECIFEDLSLSAGEMCTYKVRAYKEAYGERIYGDYGYSDAAITGMLAPENCAAEKESYYMSLTWSESDFAQSYSIYRSAADSEEICIATVETCAFSDTDVVPGVEYTYSVTAMSEGVESEASEKTSAVSELAASEKVTAKGLSHTVIRLEWSLVDGADGYDIYRSGKSDDDFEKIGSTEGICITDTDLEKDTAYYYQVVPYRTSGTLTGYGNTSETVSALTKFNPPTKAKVSRDDNNDFKLTWTPAPGAEGYIIYRAPTKEDKYKELARIEGGDTAEYIDKGSSKKKYYSYKVISYCTYEGEQITSGFSNEAREKFAYLTFDDGPSENTFKYLDILDQYGIKATFFVVSQKNRDAEYKAIVERGHTIALHCYIHKFAKVYASKDAYYKDLNNIYYKVYNITGVKTKILRFPGGSSNSIHAKFTPGLMDELKVEVLEKGYIYHDWNVDSGDSTGVNVPVQKIISNVKRSVKDKTVVNVLMHDTRNTDTTVEALPEIIEYLLDQGYTILPITKNTTPIVH